MKLPDYDAAKAEEIARTLILAVYRGDDEGKARAAVALQPQPGESTAAAFKRAGHVLGFLAAHTVGCMNAVEQLGIDMTPVVEALESPPGTGAPQDPPRLRLL